MLANVGPPEEMNPFPDHVLAGLIRRMRLAGEHELNRMLRIGENPRQPFRIVQQQVGPFVGGEPARKAERQRVGIEDRFGRVDVVAAARP